MAPPTSRLNRLRQRQSTGNNPRRLAAEKSAYSASSVAERAAEKEAARIKKEKWKRTNLQQKMGGNKRKKAPTTKARAKAAKESLGASNDPDAQSSDDEMKDPDPVVVDKQ